MPLRELRKLSPTLRGALMSVSADIKASPIEKPRKINWSGPQFRAIRTPPTDVSRLFGILPES